MLARELYRPGDAELRLNIGSSKQASVKWRMKNLRHDDLPRVGMRRI